MNSNNRYRRRGGFFAYARNRRMVFFAARGLMLVVIIVLIVCLVACGNKDDKSSPSITPVSSAAVTAAPTFTPVPTYDAAAAPSPEATAEPQASGDEQPSEATGPIDVSDIIAANPPEAGGSSSGELRQVHFRVLGDIMFHEEQLKIAKQDDGTYNFDSQFKYIADSIGATPGCDTHGPTALLNSCLKFNHTLAGSGFILNIKFDKAIFNSEAGEETFLAVYRSYFGRLGQQLSVTVVSAEELIDAQKHPENHRDLIVRVGGYSDYFTNLTRELQENVIARTNYQTV